jgi:hypothetical protein
MVTLKECMDLTGLEVEEIDAIAEHELPQIAPRAGPFLAASDGRRGLKHDPTTQTRRWLRNRR